MSNKIKIHPTCYFFLFISIMTGNFISILLCMILLIGHECGHFFTAVILGWNTENITFYPFGGVSKFYADINRPLKEEIFVLIMGPIIQCLLFYLLKVIPLINSYYDLFTLIHYNILIFNLLPIYPLDGGRILQCVSCFLLSYYHSFIFIYLCSYSLMIIFITVLIKYPTINLMIVIIMLSTRLILEQKKIKFYLQKFFLERYLHTYHFKKKKIVSSEKGFKRDYSHLIKKDQKYILEKDYLNEKYKFIKKNNN